LKAARGTSFSWFNAEPNMIRDIIVNLTPAADSDPASAYAISLAETFNAHITGVAFAYDPPWPPSVLEAAVIDVYRTVKDNYKKDAQRALSRFEDAARTLRSFRRRGCCWKRRLSDRPKPLQGWHARQTSRWCDSPSRTGTISRRICWKRPCSIPAVRR
jgi:hypothetical protein